MYIRSRVDELSLTQNKIDEHVAALSPTVNGKL